MATQTLVFDAPPAQKLYYTGKGEDEDGPFVHGGEEFTVSEDQALEFLTNPHIPIKEVERELIKLSRERLNTIAEEVGVEDPEGFKNKEELVAAIENPPTVGQPTQGETT